MFSQLSIIFFNLTPPGANEIQNVRKNNENKYEYKCQGDNPAEEDDEQDPSDD